MQPSRTERGNYSEAQLGVACRVKPCVGGCPHELKRDPRSSVELHCPTGEGLLARMPTDGSCPGRTKRQSKPAEVNLLRLLTWVLSIRRLGDCLKNPMTSSENHATRMTRSIEKQFASSTNWRVWRE